MTNLDSIFKSRDITLPTKVHLVKAMVFPVVRYSLLFQNFPQFIVIHTVKGFGIVNKAEIDVFSGTLLLFPGSSGCWQFDF